jgi:hypothetical protein
MSLFNLLKDRFIVKNIGNLVFKKASLFGNINFVSYNIGERVKFIFLLDLIMQKERTSDSHPILIDFIDFKWGNSQARLGITFAPGKKQKNALTGTWYRDLEKDLERFAKYYKINTLVSMVEKWEMVDLQI